MRPLENREYKAKKSTKLKSDFEVRKALLSENRPQFVVMLIPFISIFEQIIFEIFCFLSNPKIQFQK